MSGGGLPAISSQCGGCKHLGRMVTDAFNGREGETRFLCTAFPRWPGIPDEIWQVKFDHRNPHEGDHGIRWEAAAPGVTHPNEEA